VLERIPHEADHFEWRGYRFEVVDMDGKRVDKILVTALQVPGGDANSSATEPGGR
jgi:putative hemolysin